MGCDIYSHAEVYRDGRWHKATGAIVTPFDEWSNPTEPFSWRNYGMFGFLADVRNYSEVPTISKVRGLPEDLSAEVDREYGPRGTSAWDAPGWFSVTWLTLAELLAYDYDRKFVDQREDPPAETTVREFLGELFFQHLDELGRLGDPENVRIVMWFDS